MRHFVQYHNPERMGVHEPDDRFGIQTDKPVNKLLGDRVWLITSEAGKPRKYSVCETFVVDSVDRNPDGPLKHLALGSSGKVFDPMIRMDEAPWFKPFLRRHANFSTGLTEIQPSTSDELLKYTFTALGEGPVIDRHRSSTRGAGFGTPENNRQVERAAVLRAQREYESEGWVVRSVERENLGYDLHCERGAEVAHVEVKGIRGRVCSFLITANELEAARTDPCFGLSVVLRALDPGEQEIRTFSGQELQALFRFEAVSYFAKPLR